MNQLLHPDFLIKQNGEGKHTSKEIEQQPAVWEKTWQKIAGEAEDLTVFLDSLYNLDNLNIVLTGAGSSAYIGDSAALIWQKYFSKPARAIPTTDLVTHFSENILTDQPLLLVSFARSGNSPESTAVIDVANQRCARVFHLIITCNANGKLASMGGNENTYVFLLPPEAEDKSLAMTNSFTSMLVAAAAIPKLLSDNPDEIKKMIETISSYADKMLSDYTEQLFELSKVDFKRVVFLGSGANQGITKESHLKVQEFTNGEIIGKFDSFLGFRHGPKAIINDDTLLVYLLSNNVDVQRYEKDLIDQINKHNIGLTTLAVSETELNNLDTDYAITLNGSSVLDEAFWAIVCALPAQIIGFLKSILHGFDPDNPSPDGTIARVVEGVTIYSDILTKED